MKAKFLLMTLLALTGSAALAQENTDTRKSEEFTIIQQEKGLALVAHPIRSFAVLAGSIEGKEGRVRLFSDYDDNGERVRAYIDSTFTELEIGTYVSVYAFDANKKPITLDFRYVGNDNLAFHKYVSAHARAGTPVQVSLDNSKKITAFDVYVDNSRRTLGGDNSKTEITLGKAHEYLLLPHDKGFTLFAHPLHSFAVLTGSIEGKAGRVRLFSIYDKDGQLVQAQVDSQLTELEIGTYVSVIALGDNKKPVILNIRYVGKDNNAFHQYVSTQVRAGDPIQALLDASGQITTYNTKK